MADPIRFVDFEEFHSTLKEATVESSATSHWSDSVFHLYLTAGATDELRFRGGIPLWLCWAAKRILIPAQPMAATVFPTKVNPPAKPYAFRMLSTPAHHDTLAAILTTFPSADLVLYGANLQSAHPGVLALHSTLSENCAALSTKARFRALVRSLSTARHLRKSLTVAGVNRRWRSPGGLAPRMAEMLFRYHLELSVLGKSACPHDCLFLTYELMPEAKAWVEWARISGKRVIHVMHGQRLPTYQITMATDLLLFSKVDEPWFRERVDPQVKIWTIGHPRLEMIRSEVGLPANPSAPRRPRIAFFSQPCEGDYSSELRMRDWAILAGLKDQAEVRFRLHPRESRKDAVDDLEKIGADFITLSEAGLKEDLAWCDAVASSWSTVSMEAAACGRGMFWTCATPERYEASQELRDHGIGVLLTNASEWDDHLNAWTGAGWREPIMVSEQRLRELGMIGDMDKPWIERLSLSAR